MYLSTVFHTTEKPNKQKCLSKLNFISQRTVLKYRKLPLISPSDYRPICLLTENNDLTNILTIHLHRIWLAFKQVKVQIKNVKLEGLFYKICLIRVLKSFCQLAFKRFLFFFWPLINEDDRPAKCQPLTKENLETHEKKNGDSTKGIEIQFFPDQG